MYFTKPFQNECDSESPIYSIKKRLFNIIEKQLYFEAIQITTSHFLTTSNKTFNKRDKGTALRRIVMSINCIR